MFIAYTGKPPHKLSLRGQYAFSELVSATRRLQIPFFILPKSFALAGKREHFFRANKVGSAEGTWQHTVEKMTRAVVYDAMYLQDIKVVRKERKRFFAELAKSKMPFFNPTLPAKNTLIELLSIHPDTKPLVPISCELQDSGQVLAQLDVVPRLWVKPIYGSGGRNIVHIANEGYGRYQVTAENLVDKRLHVNMNASDLSQLISTMRAWRPFFLQEHIELPRIDGRVVDFRVTIQRGLTGTWDITAVTARFGPIDSLWTNFHVGGDIVSLTKLGLAEFSLLEPLGINEKELAEIHRLALQTGAALEPHFPLLSVLGIDIGRDVFGKYHVYDCNSRPGRDILTDAEVSSFMSAIAGFAAHLLQVYDSGAWYSNR